MQKKIHLKCICAIVVCLSACWVEGKRVLQPFYEIKRWLKLFRKGVFRRSVKELKANTSMSQEKVDETKAMLKDLGLSD